ncbi:FAD-dependent oxidoreductase [uncultured Roseibium sp.]|uniref:NAD(P)/FAD-dependent oxidoreductase n=1 Tax=uncultured Roseibium sp. TaxID=1936171 RepID=UPI00260CA376|nr:FAD-dependent oxidoreductase [uncultured Roseibium sp.]
MAQGQAASYDIAIAGAGIFGLSIATAAIKAGQRVVVCEAETVGSGSSGGLLGALMPHMPARWNPKKEFQFQALLSLENHVRQLEAETGQSVGYSRCGRILPLTTTDKLEHHLERAEESKLRWHPDKTGFTYAVEPAGSRADWLSADAAPFGIVYETLAARVSPRQYLSALSAFVRKHATLVEGARVTGFDEVAGRVELEDDQSTLQTVSLILAGGFSTFELVEQLTGERIGRGEKGQALILDGAGLEGYPAIYCDGLYVVPHDNGTVAVGSTSDREFTDTHPAPGRSRELIERATAFCPKLKDRLLIKDWAGIRPRCHKRDPLIGKLPGYENLFVATGGFKISFGIAHQIADALIAEIIGGSAMHELPETFQPAHHFGVNRLEADG